MGDIITTDSIAEQMVDALLFDRENFDLLKAALKSKYREVDNLKRLIEVLWTASAQPGDSWEDFKERNEL